MPRQARTKSQTGIYHIMLRGINKQDIFQEDKDRLKFLNTLERYKQVSRYQLYGYCLMTNHIHLLLKEDVEPVSDAVKRISSCYVYWYNQKYNRTGHLFQERFKSEAVNDESYLLTVLRYIHQNPLKAGLCKELSEYKWSSYNDYLRKPELTDTAFIRRIFSESAEQAIKAYREFMKEEQDDKFLEESEKKKLPDEMIEKIIAQFGLKTSKELMLLEKSKQTEILKKIKMLEGVTTGQLSRITGISRYYINQL
ncbi:MAG: transposase [Ruminiclostridium sp.]|nr:transposase [Ruminiclostridium sp.]